MIQWWVHQTSDVYISSLTLETFIFDWLGPSSLGRSRLELGPGNRCSPENPKSREPWNLPEEYLWRIANRYIYIYVYPIYIYTNIIHPNTQCMVYIPTGLPQNLIKCIGKYTIHWVFGMKSYTIRHVIKLYLWMHIAWSRFGRIQNHHQLVAHDMIHVYVFTNSYTYMGASKNTGTPKWMVYNGKPN